MIFFEFFMFNILRINILSHILAIFFGPNSEICYLIKYLLCYIIQKLLKMLQAEYKLVQNQKIYTQKSKSVNEKSQLFGVFFLKIILNKYK